MSAMAIAVLLFWGYGAIGMCDVFYYHFYRFRLHERPECFKEHLLHTANVLVTPFVVAGLYVGRTAGLTLWLGTAVAAGQVIVLLTDVLEEPGSRVQLGGLPRLEYFMHIIVSMLHAASITLVLSDRPASAWSLNAPVLLEPITLSGRCWAVIVLGAMAVPLGVLHVVLASRGYRSIRARSHQSRAAGLDSTITG